MGQGQVMEILKEEGRGLSSRQIHKKLIEQGERLGQNTVSTNLSKLRRANFVIKYYDGLENADNPKYILKSNVGDKIKQKIKKMKFWQKKNCGLL